jgi:hypothetical protein
MTENTKEIEATAENTEASNAPVQSGAPTESDSHGVDDVDALVAEFEASTARPASSTIDDPAEPPVSAETVDTLLQQDASTTVRLTEQLDLSRQGGEAAQQRAAQLEQAVLELQHREWVRQDLADFDKLVNEANESLSEFSNLPPEFARRWILAEAVTDKKLREFWDNRNNSNLSPQSKRAIGGYIRTTLNKLYRAAETIPDPEATADRELIAQSIRGASGKFTAEPPPDFANMSDREFNQYTRKNFGF